MNEHIKELAAQCTTSIDYGMGKYEQFDAEKFSALLLNECLAIVEHDLNVNVAKAETDSEGKIWVNAQLTFSELIKSRFGIKHAKE